MSKKNEIMAPASKELLAANASDFPQEAGFNRIFLPRLGMYSQDVTEGKGKNMKVVNEAGTFFTEVQSEEEVVGEDGKPFKPWNKTEIGTELEAIILFQRKQLRFYDSNEEVFTSSPIFDSNDEIIPLFKMKAEVARGTPIELKARKEFQGLTAAGKPTSKLEENRILYVLYEGKIYQLNLRGTSMFAFMTYARKNVPNTVITGFGSEAKEKGSTEWNQMTFEVVRVTNQKEAEDIAEKLKEIKEGIAQEKAFYASQKAVVSKGNEDIKKEIDGF